MVFSFRVLLCLLSFFVLSCSQHQSRHGELVAAIDTGKDVFSIRGGEDALLANQVFESSAEFVLEGYAAGEIRAKFKCNLINENGTRGKSFPIKASSHTMPQSGQKMAVPLFAMLPLEALQYRENGEGPLMCFAYITHDSSGGYAHHAEDLLMHIRVQRDHDLAVYYDNAPFSASWNSDMKVQPKHLRDMFAKVRNENKQDLKFYMQCGDKKSAPMDWSASGLHLWAMYNSIEQTSAMPAQSKCLVFAEKAGSIVAYAEAFTLHNPKLPLQTRQIKSFDTVPFSLNKDLFFKDQVREKVPVNLRAKDDFEQSVVAQHSDTKWQCLVHSLNITEGHESFFESQKEPGSHNHIYKKHSSEFLKHGMKWRTLMESRSSFEVVEVHNPNSFPLKYDIVNSYKYHEQHIGGQIDDYKLPLRQARFAVCAQAFADLSTVYESKGAAGGFYDDLKEVQSIQLAANESKVFVVQKPLSHPCALTPFFYSCSGGWMLRHRPTEAISQSLVRKALENSDKAFDADDWAQDIASHDSYYCWTQKERVKDPDSWAGRNYDSMLSAKHINTAAKRTYVGYDLGVQLRLSRESEDPSFQHQRDATLDIQNLIAPKQIEARWSNKLDKTEGWALHKADVEIISVKKLSPFTD